MHQRVVVFTVLPISQDPALENDMYELSELADDLKGRIAALETVRPQLLCLLCTLGRIRAG